MKPAPPVTSTRFTAPTLPSPASGGGICGTGNDQQTLAAAGGTDRRDGGVAGPRAARAARRRRRARVTDRRRVVRPLLEPLAPEHCRLAGAPRVAGFDP